MGTVTVLFSKAPAAEICTARYAMQCIIGSAKKKRKGKKRKEKYVNAKLIVAMQMCVFVIMAYINGIS